MPNYLKLQELLYLEVKMNINSHFALFVNKDSTNDISNYLSEQNIVFNVTNYIDNRIIITFDIDKNDDSYSIIEDSLKKFNPIITNKVLYSKEELDNAQWLGVLCYNGRIDIPTEEAYNATFSVFCPECKNKSQIGLYHIKKVPKWKSNKNFCSIDTGGWDEIFCSSYAKQIFEVNNISGIEFLPVLHYKSLQQMEDIWQIRIKTVLNPTEIGFFPKPIEKECSICHKVTYMSSTTISQPTFNRVDLENLDAFIIPVNTLGCNILVVSNKLYKILRYEYKERSLDFAACKVIENSRKIRGRLA